MGISVVEKMSQPQKHKRAVSINETAQKKFGADIFSTDLRGGHRQIIENLGLGTYVLQNGRFCHVDARFLSILGFAELSEVVGRSFWEFIHPDDHKLVRIVISYENGNCFADLPVFRMYRKNRGIVWVQMGGSRVVYQGKPANMGYLANVTNVKRKMSGLEDSLKRYETILNEVDVQLSEIDMKGNITFINDAGCRIWDLPRHKLLGDRYKEYMTEETTDKLYHIYRKVYETGIPVKNTVLNVKDYRGIDHTMEKSISLIRNEEGAKIGFRMVTKDITERKEAEDKLNEHRLRLEAIFGSVKDAIITVDPNLMVIEANKSTETICGVSAKDLTGKEFSACRADCCQSCHEVLKHALKKKVAIKEFLIECDHRHRHNQVVSVSSSPLVSSKGEFMGAVLVIRDMTLLRDLKRELRQRNQFHNIIGRNRTMQDIYHLLEDLANVDTTVLVTGESGTGKELVARALHYSGNRSFKPFVTVNCSALAESLLESELFGHIKGAFTGAINDKQGRFQAAHGGTILLDEIGDVSPMIQMRLLRVLQEKEFERVGETTTKKVNVRVIACTNKDLKEKVRRGEFRQDLYYRLKVVEITMPPLRDRLEDLPLLVEHFTSIFNKRFNKNIKGISNEVLSRFMNYSWAGNVRELEHVMEHAFVLCHGGVITMKHLPGDIRTYTKNGKLPLTKHLGRRSLGAQEILDALNRTGWNKAKAARLLGIGRRTIYRKIDAYQLTRSEY